MDKVSLTLATVAMASFGALVGSTVPIGASSSIGDARQVRFTICHTGGGRNCVVDGDTAWIDGVRVRVADIDAPETHPSRCPEEARLGDKATQRLRELLSAGPFEMRTIDRDEDPFGRKLRILVREGQSLGGVLVTEGVARWYRGGRQPWC